MLACLAVIILLLCSSALADHAVYGGASFDTDSEWIDLGEQVVDDFPAFYQFLEKFPHLKKVDMFATPVRREQVEEMASRFRSVEFGWTIHFEEHVVRTDATAFSTLHMSNAKKHGDRNISLVRYCRHLRALDIGHNSVTDLSFLYDLPELRVLIIACNQVEDITPIASLKNLEYLELFTNKIRDITPLTGLTHLMDLNIAFNYIQDISPIFTLKSLKRLWTGMSVNRGMGMSFSRAQIDEVMAAFPHLELNNSSNPTGGTWREHPHFEAIHTFFRTGVYVPFEDSILVDDGEDPDIPVKIDIDLTGGREAEPIPIPAEDTGEAQSEEGMARATGAPLETERPESTPVPTREPAATPAPTRTPVPTPGATEEPTPTPRRITITVR